MRGSILAVDGQPLAQTVALYSVYVDFKTEALDDTLYMNLPSSNVNCLDVLCTYLAENYPEKSKQEYADYITKRKEQGRRDCYLLRNISEEQFYDFYNMPMLKDRRDAYRGRNQGIGKERSFERSYPYGTLASVVLGKSYEGDRRDVAEKSACICKADKSGMERRVWKRNLIAFCSVRLESLAISKCLLALKNGLKTLR